MASSGPETKLVLAIMSAILDEHPNAWILKVHGNPYQRGGVPDLLVTVNGILVGLEVKCRRASESVASAVGRTTLRQWQEIRRIREAGGYASVVLDVGQALDVIRLALSGEHFTHGHGVPYGPPAGSDSRYPPAKV